MKLIFIIIQGALSAIMVSSIAFDVEIKEIIIITCAALSFMNLVLKSRSTPDLLIRKDSKTGGNSQIKKMNKQQELSAEFLVETEEFHKTLINQMNEGVVITDSSFNVVYINPMVSKITGYSEAEIKRINFASILVEESLEYIIKTMDERSQVVVDQITTFEIKIKHKTGAIIPVLVSGSPLIINGDRVGSVAVLTDISIIKETETAWRKSEEQYRMLVNQMNEGIFVIDKDLNLRYVNPQILRLSGYSEEEVLGKPVLSFCNEELMASLLLKIEERRQGKSGSYEIDFLTKGGETISLFISGKPLFENGEFNGALVAVADITKLKEMQRALLSSEKKYRLLVENSPDLIIIHKDHIITFINERGAQMLKADNAQRLIGRNILDFIEKKSERIVENWVSSRVDYHSPSSIMEESFRDIDGNVFDVDVIAVPFDLGEETYIQIVARDISKRKEMEKALQKHKSDLEGIIEERTRELKEAKEKAEEANRLKTEFLANISHELRTPMHAILSYSKFGIEKIHSKPKDRIQQYFRNIRTSGQRLMYLLNDLLDLSRLQSKRADYMMDTWDICTVFSDMQKEFAALFEEKEIQLNIQKTAPAYIRFDVVKIKQVISNLFDNALRFSHPNTTIEVLFKIGKEMFIVTVKNKGIPIPENELESIFKPFVQSSKTKTGAGGTGLGLSICKRIIEDHSGEIWAEEDPEGATISFYLPHQ